MSARPASGSMVYWRFRKGARDWRFGYCTYAGGELMRMGRWNGDTAGGLVVLNYEIEWRPHN